MNDSVNMYDDFSNVVSNEESISTESVLDILKEYAGTISVFDLMKVNAEMIEESKYVQDSYKHKSHEVYAKYFLGRIKDVHSDDNKYEHDIDKEEFIDAISTLKSYHINESVTSKTKFPLIARCALLSNWNFNISNQHLYFANFCKNYSTFFLIIPINKYTLNINISLTKS